MKVLKYNGLKIKRNELGIFHRYKYFFNLREIAHLDGTISIDFFIITDKYKQTFILCTESTNFLCIKLIKNCLADYRFL